MRSMAARSCPSGQLTAPTSPELERFRALAAAYGAAGLSFFDLDAAQPQELAALSAPLSNLPRRALTAPTMHPGTDGDQIVQAQELLNAAGARLQVGGFYGTQTAHAVASFQARHHLRPDGILNPATGDPCCISDPASPPGRRGHQTAHGEQGDRQPLRRSSDDRRANEDPTDCGRGR